MPPWPDQNDVDTFYGDPRAKDGGPSMLWVADNLVYVKAPWPLVTSWDGRPVRAIRIHRECAKSLEAVLDAVWTASGKDEKVIEEWGMHLYGGGYEFRPMKGGDRLSMHSWGCAVDFDPARNGLGDPTPRFAGCPDVLAAFAAERWVWGGEWKKPDGMHWQAAIV